MSSGVANVHDVKLAKDSKFAIDGMLQTVFRLILGITLATIGVYYLDDFLVRFCTTGNLPGDLERAIMLCESFSHGSGVALILLILFSMDSGIRRRLLVVATCAYGSGMAANLIKVFVSRLRPSAMVDQGLDAVASFQGLGISTVDQLLSADAHTLQAFPSAHTATAFGFAVGLVWCYRKGRVPFFLLAVMAGIQRIVVAAHWPSDVVAGATLGLIVAPAIIAAMIRLWPKLQKSRAVEARTLEVNANDFATGASQ